MFNRISCIVYISYHLTLKINFERLHLLTGVELNITCLEVTGVMCSYSMLFHRKHW